MEAENTLWAPQRTHWRPTDTHRCPAIIWLLGERCVDILNGKAVWAAGVSLTLGASVVLACHHMTMQADI